MKSKFPFRGGRITPLVLTLAIVGLAAGRIAAQEAAAAGAQRQLAVAAVQTKLQFYFEPEQFAAQMDQRMQAAMQQQPNLVVFPEDIGITLLALGDKDVLEGCSNHEEAIKRLLGKYAQPAQELIALHKVSPVRALWLVKIPMFKEVYRKTFSELAKRYQVHIIAGSIPLVLPREPSEVYNMSCLFNPAGEVRVVASKVHPIPLEQAGGLDLSSGKPGGMKVVEVAGVKVGVLVCADAWDPKLADSLVKQGAELLVQVSANPEVWASKTRIAWREGLYTQVQRLGVYGVSCMGVGQLFELPFQGQSAIIVPKSMTQDGEGILKEAASATEEEVVGATLTFPPSK